MTPKQLLEKLRKTHRRGSKPRCHLLTHGDKSNVAKHLTDLIKPWGQVRDSDFWMPNGFEDGEEAQLHKESPLLNHKISEELGSWWLKFPNKRAMTPSWDIASRCLINGKPGLLLVEAKAHSNELTNEDGPKRLSSNASQNSRANHDQIGDAIQQANDGLAQLTKMSWNLSRDHCYQLSNRFAWSWKLAELGVPVIIVYLGFLDATEMREKNSKVFANKAEWEKLVLDHSNGVVPKEGWGNKFDLRGSWFIPLILADTIPLE